MIRSVAAVSASVAVAITTGASGAQNGECSEGSWTSPFCARSHSACGTPPTQKIRLSILALSARYYRLKSSPPITAGVSMIRPSKRGLRPAMT